MRLWTARCLRFSPGDGDEDCDDDLALTALRGDVKKASESAANGTKLPRLALYNQRMNESFVLSVVSS